MFAVLAYVKIDPARTAEAETMLQTQVVPGVKQLPGFAGATWFRSTDGSWGSSFVLFETREQAEAASKSVEAPPGAPVSVERVEVVEVVAQA